MNKVYNIPVELDEKRQEQMSGLEALHRLVNRMDDEERGYYMFVNGEMRFVDYTTRFLALPFVSVSFGVKQSFDDVVKRERGFYCRALFEKGQKADVLSIFMAYPALVYEGEEKLLADLKREVALEQANALPVLEVGDVPTRNPSPDEAGPEEPGADGEEEEPETLVMVRDASGVVREVTLDEAEEMREAAQGIYNGEPPEPDFEPDAPEEEPETVSNAEDKRSPLIKDNSDGYFYYLEHGHWPPDDEVLAGADVPCTGDYGLSDCLVVTQSALDFVDAFFVGQGREHET